MDVGAVLSIEGLGPAHTSGADVGETGGPRRTLVRAGLCAVLFHYQSVRAERGVTVGLWQSLLLSHHFQIVCFLCLVRTHVTLINSSKYETCD